MFMFTFASTDRSSLIAVHRSPIIAVSTYSKYIGVVFFLSDVYVYVCFDALLMHNSLPLKAHRRWPLAGYRRYMTAAARRSQRYNVHRVSQFNDGS